MDEKIEAQSVSGICSSQVTEHDPNSEFLSTILRPLTQSQSNPRVAGAEGCLSLEVQQQIPGAGNHSPEGTPPGPHPHSSGDALSLCLNTGDLPQAQSPAARGPYSDFPFSGSFRRPEGSAKVRGGPRSEAACVPARPFLGHPAPPQSWPRSQPTGSS